MPLTPAALHQYIVNAELPLRVRQAGQVAGEILCRGAIVGSLIEHHRILTRCRDRLLELLDEADRQGIALPSGTVVMADQLNASVGRFQRQWHAPEGGLWLSLLLADSLLPSHARLLPFALGVACCETIRFFGVDVTLKWVNDVHAGGRKLAGVLCETVRSGGGEAYHILGVGINGNNSVFAPQIASLAISMEHLLGQPVDLAALRLQLLAKMRWNIGLLHYMEHKALAEEMLPPGCDLLKTWRSLSDTLGRRICYGFDLEKNPPIYEALALDVDDQGGLVMQLADGCRLTEYAGEIRYIGGMTRSSGGGVCCVPAAAEKKVQGL